LPETPAAVARDQRRIYLDDLISALVYHSDSLPPGQTIGGPAIVEGIMTTVLLRPADRATVPRRGWPDTAIMAS
jgi:N-methylhydantoinase A/oxoprolinase/acetone carboxylase beta subunit